MVGPPTHDFNFPVSLIYSYLYSIIHVLYVCSIWTISILNTLCCLMTFPKEHSIFRLHILFCRITSLRKKVGPHEKLPWAQSVIRKGFTGDTSLNTIKIYTALEKLLKDHAGRYATEDEIFLCKITWRILIGVAWKM
ncbi:Glutathione S-transferase zeta class [Arachis hypogaea]|nr:Glutathione S-transferase zeta class [Arachis hypogaea]